MRPLVSGLANVGRHTEIEVCGNAISTPAYGAISKSTVREAGWQLGLLVCLKGFSGLRPASASMCARTCREARNTDTEIRRAPPKQAVGCVRLHPTCEPSPEPAPHQNKPWVAYVCTQPASGALSLPRPNKVSEPRRNAAAVWRPCKS